MDLPSNLRILRVKKNKSQQEVADLLNIDRRTYINWENGSTSIKSEFIPILANILDVQINDLFEERKSKIEIMLNDDKPENPIVNNAVIILKYRHNEIDDIINILRDKLK